MSKYSPAECDRLLANRDNKRLVNASDDYELVCDQLAALQEIVEKQKETLTAWQKAEAMSIGEHGLDAVLDAQRNARVLRDKALTEESSDE